MVSSSTIWSTQFFWPNPLYAVAGPDLQIGRGRSSTSWDKQKENFRPFGPQFGLNIRVGLPPPPPPPHQVPPRIRHWHATSNLNYLTSNWRVSPVIAVCLRPDSSTCSVCRMPVCDERKIRKPGSYRTVSWPNTSYMDSINCVWN